MKRIERPDTRFISDDDLDVAPWRLRLERWIESPRVQWFVVGVIAFNAVVLGALTTSWGRGSGHSVLSLLDNACLAIFVCEISCKLIAVGPRFFRSGWNIFDFVVVAVSLVPASGASSALRAIRALRILRLVSAFPQMRRVVAAVFAAVPGMISIIALLGLVFYIAAVMATSMFGEKFPEWFGDLGASAYTLFQIMTLESWSMGIVRPVMEVYPWAWAFFVPFIVLSAFTVLNLFLAVIVDSMQAIQRRDDPDAESSEAAGTAASAAPALSGEQTAELRQEIADLRTTITLLHAELRAGDDDRLADPH